MGALLCPPAIVYARAPPSFQNRYFSVRQNGASLTSLYFVAKISWRIRPFPQFKGHLLCRVSVPEGCTSCLVRIYRSLMGTLTVVVFWGVELARGMSQSPGRRADEDAPGG